MAAAIAQSSVTHASQKNFENMFKSSTSQSSPESQGFAALLESSQVGGTNPMMTQSGLDPVSSLYLQQLESSAKSVKPVEETEGPEINLGQSGTPDISDSVWKMG